MILPLTHLQDWYVWHTRSSQHASLPPLAPQDLALSFSTAQLAFGFLVHFFWWQTNPGQHSGDADLYLDPHCDEYVLSPEQVLYSSREVWEDEKNT